MLVLIHSIQKVTQENARLLKTFFILKDSIFFVFFITKETIECLRLTFINLSAFDQYNLKSVALLLLCKNKNRCRVFLFSSSSGLSFQKACDSRFHFYETHKLRTETTTNVQSPKVHSLNAKMQTIRTSLKPT